MRPFGVVVLAPLFDHDPRLLQAVEDLPVEQFVTKLGHAEWKMPLTVVKRRSPGGRPPKQ